MALFIAHLAVRALIPAIIAWSSACVRFLSCLRQADREMRGPKYIHVCSHASTCEHHHHEEETLNTTTYHGTHNPVA